MDIVYLLPVLGGIGGLCLGYVARRNFFCTLTSLERLWYSNDSAGFRSWMLAALTAAVMTQSAIQLGWIDLSQSFYLTTEINLPATIVGGLAFGFGMALVGTCGFGALVRLGGGSLKSLIAVLVIGLTAMSTQSGLFAWLRFDQIEITTLSLQPARSQSVPDIAAVYLGDYTSLWIAWLLIGIGLVWVFSNRDYLRDHRSIGSGIAVGAIIFFGWLSTAYVASNSYESIQIESASFVAPVADTLFQYALRIGVFPDYGVGMVMGVIVGAFIAARLSDDMRWEACDDVPELLRHIAGAMLMGIGGILSLGCTIGQGVSAASLLTLSAPVTLISILVGARMGLAYLVEGSAFSPFYRR